MVVVGLRAKGIGVSTEGDFFTGIGAKDKSDNFQLATGARIDLVFVEFEVEGEGVATLGIFDQGGVIDVATSDAVGVFGEELIKVDFGDEPVPVLFNLPLIVTLSAPFKSIIVPINAPSIVAVAVG